MKHSPLADPQSPGAFQKFAETGFYAPGSDLMVTEFRYRFSANPEGLAYILYSVGISDPAEVSIPRDFRPRLCFKWQRRLPTRGEPGDLSAARVEREDVAGHVRAVLPARQPREPRRKRRVTADAYGCRWRPSRRAWGTRGCRRRT